jgi:hypothetical protein
VGTIKGKPGRDSDQFLLRLPDGMRERILSAAEVNGRSMNAEIIARLKTSFESGYGLDEVLKRLEKLEQRMGEFEERQHAKKHDRN